MFKKTIDCLCRDLSRYIDHYELEIKNLVYKIYYIVFFTTFPLVVLFRLSSIDNKLFKILFRPAFAIFRWFYDIQLLPGTSVGPGLFFPHRGGIGINKNAKIGNNCTILRNVSIAAKGVSADMGFPVIGDNVYIGVGSCILGSVIVENGAVIGACAVVVKSVPKNSVVVGNPAQVKKTL
ncbi:MAG: exopolysaccharide biosynthesis acetyltransferase VpsC [Geothermobacteraceae bacterium]